MSAVAEKQKERYLCPKYPDLVLVYKSGQSGYRLDEEGRQIVYNVPAQYINFSKGVLETSDPDIISFIENHGHFTGQGQIRVITKSAPADPNQVAIMRYIQTYGYAGLAQQLGITGAQQQSQPQQVADPIAHTMQHVQQQQIQPQTAPNPAVVAQQYQYQQQQLAQAGGR